MNLSRLAALAVILMMVLSTFVAIPTYNARADHDNHDDHDHEDHGDDDDYGLPSFSELDENGNGTIEFSELMAICPEDQSEDQCRGIFDQYSGDDDVIDENEYQAFVSDVTGPGAGHNSMMVCYDSISHEIVYSITSPEDCQGDGLMWVSTDDGPDSGDDDWNLENLHAHLKMESLSEWLVTLRGDLSGTDSDMLRQGVSEMCEDMMGTNSGEISQECYDHWVMMMENDDYDGHHGGDHGCPPGLSEDDCRAMQECQNGSMNMSCMRLMYDYCKDNPNVCDSNDEDNGDNHPDHHDTEDGLHHHGDEDYHHDHEDGSDGYSHADYDRHHSHDGDDLNFFNEMFAYEDGDLTAEEFLASDAVQDLTSGMDMDDDDGDWFDAHDSGLYDLYTFSAASDGEVMIEIEFIEIEMEDMTFICGNGDEIPFSYVNDGWGDCDDGADEQWYDNNTPDDTSDDCQMWNDDDCDGEPVNWFDCHDGSQIYIDSVNDGYWDCEDGEDEDQNSGYTNWYGDVFLMEGEVSSEDIGDELTADQIITRSGSFCDWGDENKTYIDCTEIILADLVAGNSYTIVTKGNSWTDYTSDDEEIVHFGIGSYHHVMFDSSDSHVMNISGNITVDSPVADFLDAKTTDNDFGEFVMYHAETFIVGDEGFTGMLTSYLFQCYEYGDIEECYSSHGMLYVYDALDMDDTSSGLIGSMMANYYSDDDDEIACPDEIESCNVIHMEMDLSPGTLTRPVRLPPAFRTREELLPSVAFKNGSSGIADPMGRPQRSRRRRWPPNGSRRRRCVRA